LKGRGRTEANSSLAIADHEAAVRERGESVNC